jgi:hypothetical protein
MEKENWNARSARGKDIVMAALLGTQNTTVVTVAEPERRLVRIAKGKDASRFEIIREVSL